MNGDRHVTDEEEILVMLEFTRQVGAKVIALMGASFTLGHSSFQGTYHPYLPDESLDRVGQVLRAFLMDGNEAVQERWPHLVNLVQRWGTDRMSDLLERSQA